MRPTNVLYKVLPEANHVHNYVCVCVCRATCSSVLLTVDGLAHVWNGEDLSVVRHQGLPNQVS